MNSQLQHLILHAKSGGGRVLIGSLSFHGRCFLHSKVLMQSKEPSRNGMTTYYQSDTADRYTPNYQEHYVLDADYQPAEPDVTYPLHYESLIRKSVGNLLNYFLLRNCKDCCLEL